MRLLLPVGVLVAVSAGAVAVAVWASVADAPWEDSDGAEGQSNVDLLCQDALERRKAVEAALQAPVVRGSGQAPLSAYRGREPGDPFRDEITRLESKLREIERDIRRFCE